MHDKSIQCDRISSMFKDFDVIRAVVKLLNAMLLIVLLCRMKRTSPTAYCDRHCVLLLYVVMTLLYGV